jgi:beta-glucosidase
MPGPAGPWGDALVDAVRSGEVAEAVVDDHLRRLLRLADRVGALGNARPAPGTLARAGRSGPSRAADPAGRRPG